MKKCLEKNFGSISDATIDIILQIAEPVFVAKNEIILHYGSVCKHLWFLEKGAVKGYELNNGENRNTHFFMEDSFFTNYVSLLTNQPTELEFRAVEDCNLLKINAKALENLYAKYHELEHIGRRMAELQFISEYNLRKLLLNMTATERYEYIEANQPEIISRFSQKDIASYIGITHVSLSRLKKLRFDNK
jgi:CRP-like cAMP-binding protein